MQLGDPVSADTKRTICVKFVSINKIGVGNDCGNPCVFTLLLILHKSDQKNSYLL